MKDKQKWLRIFSFVSVLGILLAANQAFRFFPHVMQSLKPSQTEKKKQYAHYLKEGNAQIVFVGSSTVDQGVDPDVISSHINYTAFNAGQFGYASPNLALQVVEDLLKTKKVKIIIYAIDSWALSSALGNRQEIDSWGRVDHFLWSFTLYHNRAVFFHWISLLAHGRFVTPHEASIDFVRKSGQWNSFESAIPRPNGFLELKGSLNPEWPDYPRPGPVLPVQISNFELIIHLCIKAGVQIIILRMPEFEQTYLKYVSGHSKMRELIDGIALQNHVPVLDFSLPGAFAHGNKELYFDVNHLNSKGAEIFSSILAERLNPLLRKE
jgi:hypothetical protein